MDTVAPVCPVYEPGFFSIRSLACAELPLSAIVSEGLSLESSLRCM